MKEVQPQPPKSMTAKADSAKRKPRIAGPHPTKPQRTLSKILVDEDLAAALEKRAEEEGVVTAVVRRNAYKLLLGWGEGGNA